MCLQVYAQPLKESTTGIVVEFLFHNFLLCLEFSILGNNFLLFTVPNSKFPRDEALWFWFLISYLELYCPRVWAGTFGLRGEPWLGLSVQQDNRIK